MLAVAAVLAVAAALADCVVAVVGGGPIVTSVFGAHNPRADAMSKNDDDDYQAKQRKYKRTTVELLSHDLFKAQLQISFIAKGPLTHFLAWAQKEIKRDNEARLMAERRGEANVGQTFLSNLVATKARAIWEEMSALLSDASVMDKWVPVWAVCGGPAVTSARALIISLVTRSAAEWKWRFLDRCESFPLCLLVLLEEPQAAPSPRRMEIAKRLLGTCRRCVERDRKQRSIPTRRAIVCVPPCRLCLERQDGAHSSFTAKLLDMRRGSFQRMATDGVCEPALYMHLLAVRVLLLGETQEVEGWSSVLQIMCTRARRMGVACASARLSMKCGMKARHTPLLQPPRHCR